MNLLIDNQTSLWPELNPISLLETPLSALLLQEQADADVEISLLVTDDVGIRKLNKTYRGKDSPTDVLSFAQGDPIVLGDIVISVETALRQADAAKWPAESEFVLLAVHGALHLLGYEDDTDQAAQEMQDRTVSVFERCGLALPPSFGVDHPFFTRY